MTYAQKLLMWRAEMAHMAKELLESDDPEPAQKLVQAIATIKDVHTDLARIGLDECEWSAESKP